MCNTQILLIFGVICVIHVSTCSHQLEKNNLCKMKNNMSNYKILILLISIVVLNSCDNENPCETPREGEIFMLSDSIKSYISNYEDTEKIIFKTEMGDEVSFDVSELQSNDGEYVFGGMCESDITQSQSVNGTYQLMQLSLSNPIEIEEPLFILLSEAPLANSANDIVVKESINVTSSEWLSDSYSFVDGDGLFEIRLNDGNDEFILHDSLAILGKTFYAVFEPQNLLVTPKLDIKYTVNEGIIFIGNTSNGKEYVYERKE